MAHLHWIHSLPKGAIEITCPTDMTAADIEDFRSLFYLALGALQRGITTPAQLIFSDMGARRYPDTLPEIQPPAAPEDNTVLLKIPPAPDEPFF